MDSIWWIIIVLVVAAIFFVRLFIRKSLAEAKISSAEHAALQIVESAKKEAEALKKETVLEAKDEVHKIRAEAEKTLVSAGMKFNGRSADCCKRKSRWIKIESLERKEEQVANKEKRIEETQQRNRCHLQETNDRTGAHLQSDDGGCPRLFSVMLSRKFVMKPLR